MVSRASICFDTNLLIDILSKRARYDTILSQFKDVKIYATSYSIGTLYYFAKKQEKVNNTAFRAFIENIQVLAVDALTIEEAFRIVGNDDLEDAIQIAATKQAGLRNFATADKKLANTYSHLINIELVS